jgi:hypothetical protein
VSAVTKHQARAPVREHLDAMNSAVDLIKPIVVLRETGALHVTGTARPVDDYLEQFRRRTCGPTLRRHARTLAQATPKLESTDGR